MRTTLTLDDDVASRLEQLRKKRKMSLKQIVNQALRAGFDALEARSKRRRKRYLTKPYNPRGVRVVDVDNVAEVLAAFEGEGWR